MSRALQLARKGFYTTHPNPRVGCVLVKQDQVIGEGWHIAAGGPHAEIHALAQADKSAEGADCYITLEPCSHTGRTSPCAEALIEAKVAKAIVAMPDPNPKVAGQGIEMLKKAGIKVDIGLMQEQAEKLNPGFIKRMTEGRPYVRCKLAMSLDGRTAMSGGESKWITGADARADVQKLRAQSAAIMTGIGTILADDPQLNVRSVNELEKQPLRVIVDRDLRCSPAARILQAEGRTLIFSNRNRREKDTLEKAGAEVVTLDAGDTIFLSELLTYLAEQEEINEVLLESGAQLAGSMLTQGLLDEIVLYQAPVLLGDGAKSLFHLPGLNKMTDKICLDITDRRVIGEDLRITARVINKS